MRYALAAILALFVVTCSVAAKSHGDYRWVMDNSITSYCCGPEDCQMLQLTPGQLSRTVTGYILIWNGKPYEFVYPDNLAKPSDKFDRKIIYPSNNGAWHVCFRLRGPGPEDDEPRCLFEPPTG